MSVMELGLLSGFESTDFSITDIGILKRVDTADTKQEFYFDQVGDVHCSSRMYSCLFTVSSNFVQITGLYY